LPKLLKKIIHSFPSNKKIINEFFWVLIGNIANIAGIMAVIKLMSYFLTPNEYGLYYLGITVSVFATQIFFGPFGNGFTRYYLISENNNELNSFLISSYTLLIKLTKIIIISSVIFFVFLYYFYGIGNFIYFISLFLIAILTGYTSIVYSYFHIIRQRRIIAFYQIFDALIKIIFVFSSLYFFDKKTENVLVSIAIGSLFIFLHQLKYLYKNKVINLKIQQKSNTNWAKNIFDFSYPFAIWGIFGWLQISSDRWFLGYFKSSAEVAKYAIIFQLGYYPPSIVIGNLVQTITPLLYHKAGDGNDLDSLTESSSVTKKITFISIFITVIGFLVTFFFSSYFLKLLSNSKYVELSNLFPYMVVSGGVFATAQILSIDFQSRMKIKQLLYIKIGTSLFGVLFSGLTIYYFGLIGSVISSIGFSSCYLFAIVYFSKWLRIKV
jgi:O-antigen/teichoic acid export membrane protein